MTDLISSVQVVNGPGRKYEVTQAPQMGGEITLIRYKDKATGNKEYGCIVLGEGVNNDPGNRWSRAQDALDTAMAALPKIKAKQEEARAARMAEVTTKTVSKAEVMAAFGDTGPQADEALEYDDLGNPFVVKGDGEAEDAINEQAVLEVA